MQWAGVRAGDGGRPPPPTFCLTWGDYGPRIFQELMQGIPIAPFSKPNGSTSVVK